MPAIVVPVLAFSYQEQLAWVRRGRGCTSATFRISNGTRQGSVASPAFWSVYLDPLFALLSRDSVGCHVADVFMGTAGYADDLILLAPSQGASQKMLEHCERFAQEHNIMFSTTLTPTIARPGQSTFQAQEEVG